LGTKPSTERLRARPVVDLSSVAPRANLDVTHLTLWPTERHGAPSTVGSMTETSNAAQAQVCEICGALMGDPARHAKWHRDLPGQIARRQSALGA